MSTTTVQTRRYRLRLITQAPLPWDTSDPIVFVAWARRREIARQRTEWRGVEREGDRPLRQNSNRLFHTNNIFLDIELELDSNDQLTFYRIYRVSQDEARRMGTLSPFNPHVLLPFHLTSGIDDELLELLNLTAYAGNLGVVMVLLERDFTRVFGESPNSRSMRERLWRTLLRSLQRSDEF